jgi:hypothetical protein
MPSLPAGFDPLVPLLGLAGLVWGVVADRISARWPAHEDGTVRKVDWRRRSWPSSAAVALAAVPVRFGDPGQRLLFGVFFAACVLLMATDLDQRLMPDVVTLPLIVLGAVACLGRRLARVAVAGLDWRSSARLPCPACCSSRRCRSARAPSAGRREVPGRRRALWRASSGS